MAGAGPRILRAIVVVLLLGGAYFALQPWLSCASALGGRLTTEMARFCTFGSGIAGFPEPRWPSLFVAVTYIGAAAWLASTKRIDFGAGGAPKP